MLPLSPTQKRVKTVWALFTSSPQLLSSACLEEEYAVAGKLYLLLTTIDVSVRHPGYRPGKKGGVISELKFFRMKTSVSSVSKVAEKLLGIKSPFSALLAAPSVPTVRIDFVGTPISNPCLELVYVYNSAVCATTEKSLHATTARTTIASVINIFFIYSFF